MVGDDFISSRVTESVQISPGHDHGLAYAGSQQLRRSCRQGKVVSQLVSVCQHLVCSFPAWRVGAGYSVAPNQSSIIRAKTEVVGCE